MSSHEAFRDNFDIHRPERGYVVGLDVLVGQHDPATAERAQAEPRRIAAALASIGYSYAMVIRMAREAPGHADLQVMLAGWTRDSNTVAGMVRQGLVTEALAKTETLIRQYEENYRMTHEAFGAFLDAHQEQILTPDAVREAFTSGTMPNMSAALQEGPNGEDPALDLGKVLLVVGLIIVVAAAAAVMVM